VQGQEIKCANQAGARKNCRGWPESRVEGSERISTGRQISKMDEVSNGEANEIVGVIGQEGRKQGQGEKKVSTVTSKRGRL